MADDDTERGHSGVVHIPWYATLFRGDQFASALKDIAPVALRYGASHYRVYRSRDDTYKFLHTVVFDSHNAWDRYWMGEEFSVWRAEHSGWYQVPILPVWNEVVIEGGLSTAQDGVPV